MTVDYLIIGSGIAGLSLAIRLSEFGTVLIVSKKRSSSVAANSCNLLPFPFILTHQASLIIPRRRKTALRISLKRFWESEIGLQHYKHAAQASGFCVTDLIPSLALRACIHCSDMTRMLENSRSVPGSCACN